jgi:hypothetical protein
MNRVTIAMAVSALPLLGSGGAHEAPVAGSPARGLSAAAPAVAYVASYGNTTPYGVEPGFGALVPARPGHQAGGWCDDRTGSA